MMMTLRTKTHTWYSGKIKLHGRKLPSSACRTVYNTCIKHTFLHL